MDGSAFVGPSSAAAGSDLMVPRSREAGLIWGHHSPVARSALSRPSSQVAVYTSSRPSLLAVRLLSTEPSSGMVVSVSRPSSPAAESISTEPSLLVAGVSFAGSRFCGGEIDFSKVADWSTTPEFDWRGTPSSDVKLPEWQTSPWYKPRKSRRVSNKLSNDRSGRRDTSVDSDGLSAQAPAVLPDGNGLRTWLRDEEACRLKAEAVQHQSAATRPALPVGQCHVRALTDWPAAITRSGWGRGCLPLR